MLRSVNVDVQTFKAQLEKHWVRRSELPSCNDFSKLRMASS